MRAVAAQMIQVGETGVGEPFAVPAEIATQATAVVGIRGSGKTVTATVLVEELLDRGLQVVVIDPTDVWWGLKSTADGKGEGYPVVVLGGPHGDLPLRPSAAPALADFAVERRVPLVLSLRHLRKNQQRRFVTEFCEQVYHRKGEAEHRTPLLVAMDEASTFIPQRVGAGEARMVGAVEDLVRRGRAAGIGVAIVDQRPASLNKDVLTQVETLVTHRITSPHDSKALDEWVRQNDTAGHRKEFLEGLPSLPKGTAWFWSPALDVFDLVRVRMRRTYDSSRTPKLGEAPRAPEAWAEVDLEALDALLSAGEEGPDEEDPAALRRRARDLEAALERASRRGGVGALERRAAELEGRVRELEADRDRAVARATAPLRERIRTLEAAAAEAEGHLAAASLALTAGRGTQNRERTRRGEGGAGSNARPDGAPEPRRHPAPNRRNGKPVAAEVPPPTPPDDDGEGPGEGPGDDERLAGEGGKRRILGALRALEERGIPEVSRGSLTVFAGFKPSKTGSGTYRGLLAELGREGKLVSEGGTLALTADGRAEAALLPEEYLRIPKDLASYHARWLGSLPAREARMLKVLIDRRPEGISRPNLASALGMSTSGTFREAVASLGKRELAVSSSGLVRATEGDLLFPKYLP